MGKGLRICGLFCLAILGLPVYLHTPEASWWSLPTTAAETLGISVVSNDARNIPVDLDQFHTANAKDFGETSLADPGSSSGLRNSLTLTSPGFPTENIPPVSQTATTYQRQQVGRWAYDPCPEAALIEQEIDAIYRGIDTTDADACCSARLIRGVLTRVALGRRQDDAALAIEAYDKLSASIAAKQMIQAALAVQDRLIRIADEAERLELPDGNPLQLREKHLELDEQGIEQTYNALKLRQELARLTGRPESEVATAILIDSLPTPNGNTSFAASGSEAVAVALTRRHDLDAIAYLCSNLRSCNVDAARMLMGFVNPGIGMSLVTVAKGLFKCLKEDKSDSDLQARRRQCAQMRASLEQVIRHQTLQAVLSVREAEARILNLREREGLVAKRLDETRRRMDVDEASPGSDLLLELELLQVRGKQIEQRLALAIAIDKLRHAQDAMLDSSS